MIQRIPGKEPRGDEPARWSQVDGGMRGRRDGQWVRWRVVKEMRATIAALEAENERLKKEVVWLKAQWEDLITRIRE